jgi:hypothetical protein
MADPLGELERQFIRNQKRSDRASIALEKAEISARKAGLPIKWPWMRVGDYGCHSAQEVKERSLAAGFSRQHTAQLLREFRGMEQDTRRAREAAGLDVLDAEIDACNREHDRLLEAIAIKPARSVADLAVKIRFMRRDIQDGKTNWADAIATSAVDDAELLAEAQHAAAL